jgi:hypothetical protein
LIGAATPPRRKGKQLVQIHSHVRSGDRIFRRYAAHLPSTVTTAFSRGYNLSPLRG